ncbi:2'-5' RNA ligase family protein [Tranquillimonas rosea]|uniref:2'-5' RNA ligase family protein n=1 Tax=Tranquillimonas rosea TaxID=641238 RepID=UPI003BAC0291
MALILTLAFDAASASRFEHARQAHFPPDRNLIPAHLTLFQQLPSDRIDEVATRLGAVTADTPPLPFTVDGILDFGRGAAYRLDMPGFAAFHGALRAAFGGLLTAQDDRRRKPHVTIQNKVDRATAEATQAALREGFSPWRGLAHAALLWHYRGGPWEAAGEFQLEGQR